MGDHDSYSDQVDSPGRMAQSEALRFRRLVGDSLRHLWRDRQGKRRATPPEPEVAHSQTTGMCEPAVDRKAGGRGTQYARRKPAICTGANCDRIR
jgi:hypothetical protein